MTVYLDHAATTPMLPAAIAAYAEAMTVVGNPASIHSQGQNAKRMLEEAREHVAVSVGCDPIEVVFTAGGRKPSTWGSRGSTGPAHHALVFSCRAVSITPRSTRSNGLPRRRAPPSSGFPSTHSDASI